MAKPVRRLTDEVPGPRQAIRARMNSFNIPHQDGVDHSVHYHTVHNFQQVKVIAFNLEKTEEDLGCVRFYWHKGCALTRIMENSDTRNKLWKDRRGKQRKECPICLQLEIIIKITPVTKFKRGYLAN